MSYHYLNLSGSVWCGVSAVSTASDVERVPPAAAAGAGRAACGGSREGGGAARPQGLAEVCLRL